MLLTVFALLLALSIGVFIVGYVTGYHEIALIGAVIVFGVGVMVTGTTLEYQSGKTEVAVDANETQINYDYTPVETPTRLPLGSLVMLTGGALVLRSLDSFR
ncbi:hypothetical protein C5B90_06370 [Haloferax sp. Atlit-12N]|uniref:hypothetical protein n=1 Tax=unclassified Haloferax TaxID=2625095 RepID=UPI000E25E1E0|nr:MULTISPECIES: hypothetical protein [unclassified Haloferax]RDZ65968.1 hypothetical protein C5B90_06370 [Haloferax sp. Atlit-12N]